jgi:hypothetical protein
VYDIRCQHGGNTQNVTWIFTSSADKSVTVLYNCLLRVNSFNCRNDVPYFNVANINHEFTSLQVVWGRLPQDIIEGTLACVLDGTTSQVCPLVIDAQTGECGFNDIWLAYSLQLAAPTDSAFGWRVDRVIPCGLDDIRLRH